jgi:hypothetical protein
MVDEDDINPDDPVLKEINAPHEVAGVMRWHRSQVPSQAIIKMLGLRGTKLTAELAKAAEQESKARELGVHIHDVTIREEPT